MERRSCLRLLGIGLVLGSTGCAETRDLLRSRPEGRWVMAEFDRYAKMADELRRNHASGALESVDVLRVLRGAGVAPAPRPTPGAPPAPAKAFPVPVYEGGYRWPLDAGVVSSEFGQRWGGPHEGIDVAADLGVPVYAAAAGEVVYADNKLRGYGNVVILRHDQKTTTVYGHNSAFKVKVGDQVRANQVIALLGSTGRSTGPHVHFEFRQVDHALNPRQVLPKSRF